MSFQIRKHIINSKASAIFTLLLLVCSSLFAQKYNAATIENVTFSFKGENVEINYDITNARADAMFNVSIEFYRNPGELLNTTSLSGDIGKSIKGGIAKKIIWNPRNDGYILDAKVFVKIKATSDAHVLLGSHIVKSLFIPGWGDYRVYKGNYHFIYGVAAYGSLGASILYYTMASTNRTNYVNCFDIEKRNKYYTTYTNQKTLSWVFAATSAAIWTYDIIKVAVKASKLKNNITPQTSTYYYNLSNKIIPGTSKVGYLNTMLPYDYAIAEAKKLFDDKKYQASRIAYENAAIKRPSETLPSIEIRRIDAILAEQKAIDDKYNAALADADLLYSKGQFEQAKDAYNKALAIKSNEQYPKNKIATIDKKNAEIALDKQYNQKMAEADEAFKNKNYETAKSLYLAASKLKPNEALATAKLQETNQILDKIQQQKDEAEYNSLIKQGDAEYNKGEYQTALYYYDKASSLKQNDEVLSNKIDVTNKKIKQLAKEALEAWDREIKKEKDKQYTSFIKQANSYMAFSDWENAIVALKQAQKLKDTEEVRTKIEACESRIASSITKNGGNDLPTLFKKCKSAVFYLLTKDYKGVSQGSGFFISSSGVCISNYHVFGDYWTDARIITEDGSEYSIGQILKKDEDLDYIIFKIKNPLKESFPKVKISSKTPEIGDKVFAIGNPKGLEKSLSDGIISGIRFENDELQTDASITHGSSGGPLFNYKGEVIGITTWGEQEGNLFFCVNIQKIPYSSYLSY